MAVRPSEREYDSAPESLESRPASSAAAASRAARAAVSARSPLPPTRAPRNAPYARNGSSPSRPEAKSPPGTRAEARSAAANALHSGAPRSARSVAAGTHCDSHICMPHPSGSRETAGRRRAAMSRMSSVSRARLASRAGPGRDPRSASRLAADHATAPETASDESRVGGKPRTGVPSTLSFHLIPTFSFFGFRFASPAAFVVASGPPRVVRLSGSDASDASARSTNRSCTSCTTAQASATILAPRFVSAPPSASPRRASANTNLST